MKDLARAVPRLAPAMTLVVLALAVAGFVIATDGRLEYDDATYLARGLFHAAQAQDRGSLLLPRLAWSLTFEAPKPPLFHTLLALSALSFGPRHINAILVAGTVVPLLALCGAMLVLADHVGRRGAGIFAVAAYLSMRSPLELGTRLFVETTLAATVIGGVFFAYRRARGGGIVDEVCFGVCAGLSLLAKLLGPLFLGPAGLVALVACWRREGTRALVRFALVAATIAGVVAAPWYARNWRAALQFALYVRTHVISLHFGPAWRRPFDFIAGSLGWPMLAVLVLVGVLYRRRRRLSADAAPGRSAFLGMTLAVVGASAAVIATQPMFDPRFWLPAQAVLASWIGVEIGDLWHQSARWGRAAIASAALLGVVHASLLLAVTKRPQTPWSAELVIARISSGRRSPSRLCTLGNTPDWNVYKLQLLAEAAGARPRPEIADLLVNGRAVAFERQLARCDVVFAVPPNSIPTAANQQALNADLERGWRMLARHLAELRDEPRVALAIGSRSNLRVFIRRHPPSA